jgi:hypothetical protein
VGLVVESSIVSCWEPKLNGRGAPEARSVLSSFQKRVSTSMNRKSWSNPRVRRSAAGSLVAIVALAAVCVFARCSGGQSVTPESVADARQLWAKAGIHSYDLEWTASGTNNAHYLVTVRDGEVRKIVSIAPDGGRFEVHPVERSFYSVDGLFTTIADELAQLRMDQPFGQSKGNKVVMRFTTDPKLGYPRYYRRDVLGTPQALEIDVLRLSPVGPSNGTSSQAPRQSAA